MDHVGHALRPVLVTGAPGYLGGRVLALLQARGLPALGIARAGKSDLDCDLLNAAAAAGLIAQHPTSPVIHCAAVVPKGAQGYADADAASQSVQMVENLVAAHPAQVVLASSMTVYPEGTRLAREPDARADAPGYAEGKLRSEQVLLKRRGANDVVLRFPGLFGEPRRGGLLFNVAMALARGKAPQLAPQLPQWAALHVDDAADLCLRAVLSPLVGPLVLNAGYAGEMSIPDAVRRLAALLERPAGDVPEAPVFAFDLGQLHRTLGPAAQGWEARLAELAALAQQLARESASA